MCLETTAKTMLIITSQIQGQALTNRQLKNLKQISLKLTTHICKSPTKRLTHFFAKDCLLTLVKGRLALRSPGCRLFVRLSPCRKWPNTQKNGCWLPPSDHIQRKTLFQTRQDQEKGMNGPASLLHSWRWVLFHRFSSLLALLNLQLNLLPEFLT